MKKFWILPIVLLQTGVFCAIYFVLNKDQESQEIVFQEPTSIENIEAEPRSEPILSVPFEHFVMADGVVIPSSDYISVAASGQEIVKRVLVSVGEYVQEGQALYEIDDAKLQTKLLEKRACVLSASAKLDDICSGTNPLEIEMKEKEVQKAKLELSLKQKESALFDDLFEQNAVSQAEKNEQISLLKMQEMEYEKLNTSLNLIKMGPSQPQRKIYEAILQEKMAELQSVNHEIKGCIVKAPISGVILENPVHVGQFSKPLVMGQTNPLFIRALVDEKDAWRLLPNSNLRALAISKSNPNQHFVLNFQRISPLLKKSADGLSKLEVLFSFEKHHAPVYLEQNFDIFIQAVSQKDTACLEYQFQSLGK